ncbi:Alpha/Beta hydrolase protein [Mycena olivaceomarginata]|nr:Alpha/Beta hydrolase protein [Mycena olivaceomarginata]
MYSRASASHPLLRVLPRLHLSQNPSAGAQSAAAFGSDCPQLPTILGAAGIPAGPPLKGANQSEDCLFVNIWRPEGTSVNDALPILVYIHGGGYFAGSGSEWDGTSLVRRSVATKEANNLDNIQLPHWSPWLPYKHRWKLSMLDSKISGTPFAGFKIMPTLLGGDSSRITISGESAGASSVHMHYLYPDSRRTFRAGISSSGTSLVSNTPACEWHDRPGGAYDILGNVTGCGTGTGSFECLRTLPFDTFWPLALSTYSAPSGGFPPWGVTCKGPKGSLIDEYPTQKVITATFLMHLSLLGQTGMKGISELLHVATFSHLAQQTVKRGWHGIHRYHASTAH